MIFDKEFPGGNITINSVEGDTVYLDRELRDTQGDWFYWAFRARGCGGRTLTFHFPKGSNRIGHWGAAVSYDLKHWHWSETDHDRDYFVYSFAPNENDVYFGHNMIYSQGLFEEFCFRENLKIEAICKSLKGRDVPSARFGLGERMIVFSARHHACESTGNYVLEGAAEYLHRHLPDDYTVILVPFIDTDGVIDGDQGKNRAPHDHNRDYLPDENAMLYPQTKALRKLILDPKAEVLIDFHSPYHTGGESDYAFIVHPGPLEKIDVFAEILTEVCRQHPTAMQYHHEKDARFGVGWNRSLDTPTSTRCAIKNPNNRLSFSFETAYFGTPDTFFTQDSGRELGRCIGEALLKYLAS